MTSQEILDAAFVEALQQEIKRAREKFPGDNLTLVALTEEVGELCQAALHIREGKHNDWGRVFREAVQVATMAMRMATEGDASVARLPADWRNV